MNLQHLKYILEVEKTQSITKAADNLYMSQPNLSRGITELERELGYDIFLRTAKGVIPTEQGGKALALASSIISQLETIKQISNKKAGAGQRFKISAPSADYIARAFSKVVSSMDLERPLSLEVSQSDAMSAANSVAEQRYSLAVIRCLKNQERMLEVLFEEKDLECEEIAVFEGKIFVAKGSPLANAAQINIQQLENCIELICNDTDAFQDSQNDGLINRRNPYRHICVCGHKMQYDLLKEIPFSYMWSAPESKDFLKLHGLSVLDCAQSALRPIFVDILVYSSERQRSQAELYFIEELYKGANSL